MSIQSRPSTVSLSEIIAVNTCNPAGGREQATECTVKYTMIQWKSWADSRVYGEIHHDTVEIVSRQPSVRWKIPYGLSIIKKNKAKEKTEAGCWGREIASPSPRTQERKSPQSKKGVNLEKTHGTEGNVQRPWDQMEHEVFKGKQD